MTSRSSVGVGNALGASQGGGVTRAARHCRSRCDGLQPVHQGRFMRGVQHFVRSWQSSAALHSVGRSKSGRGLPHSMTLREPGGDRSNPTRKQPLPLNLLNASPGGTLVDNSAAIAGDFSRVSFEEPGNAAAVVYDDQLVAGFQPGVQRRVSPGIRGQFPVPPCFRSSTQRS